MSLTCVLIRIFSKSKMSITMTTKFMFFFFFFQRTCLLSLNHLVKNVKNEREKELDREKRGTIIDFFLAMFCKKVAPLSDMCTPGLTAGGQKPLFIHDWQIIHNEKREAIQVLNFTLSLDFQGSWALLLSLVNLWGAARKGTGVTIVSLLLHSPKVLVNTCSLLFQRASSCKQFHHFSLGWNPGGLEMHHVVIMRSGGRRRPTIPKCGTCTMRASW